MVRVARKVLTAPTNVRATKAALALAIASAACGVPEPFRDEVVHTPWAATWTRALTPSAPLLFLNRCPEGCTVRPSSFDDSRRDLSMVPTSTSTLPPFPHGDDIWEETVRCVQKMFAPFELTVTDVDPGDAPHFENFVAGRPSDLGLGPEIGGIASSLCGVIDNAVSFTFAERMGNADALCVVIAHEAGHNFGLEHEMLCNDPMTYLPGVRRQAISARRRLLRRKSGSPLRLRRRLPKQLPLADGVVRAARDAARLRTARDDRRSG
jgi:hypothetical protein